MNVKKDRELQSEMRVLASIARRALPADDPMLLELIAAQADRTADRDRRCALAVIRLLEAMKDDTRRRKFALAAAEMITAVRPPGRA